MRKRLYYNPRQRCYLIVVITGDLIREEREMTTDRRYLKCNYVWPSRYGYKFIGELK